jgi:hypothetical protein
MLLGSIREFTPFGNSPARFPKKEESKKKSKQIKTKMVVEKGGTSPTPSRGQSSTTGPQQPQASTVRRSSIAPSRRRSSISSVAMAAGKHKVFPFTQSYSKKIPNIAAAAAAANNSGNAPPNLNTLHPLNPIDTSEIIQSSRPGNVLTTPGGTTLKLPRQISNKFKNKSNSSLGTPLFGFSDKKGKGNSFTEIVKELVRRKIHPKTPALRRWNTLRDHIVSTKVL